MSLPVLLVYGNCQAEAIVTILGKTRAAEIFEIVYLRSFEHPVSGRATLPADVLERCAFVWEQRDYEPFAYANRLPVDCRTTVFPSMDLNVLWPYTCNNPYNRPEPPEYPFGPFHYGDRIVTSGIKSGLDAAEILERVLNVWNERPIDLDRLMEIERARLRARDMYCDVRMGEYVLERFTRERCFFTRDHPTLSMLFDLIERLFERIYPYEPRLAAIDLDDDLRAHFPQEPLGEFSSPVHPAVARHFGLAWYSKDDHYGPRAKPMAYREYFETMIRYGLSLREEECTA